MCLKNLLKSLLLSNTTDRALRFNCVRSFSKITITNNVFNQTTDEKGEVIKGLSMGAAITVIFGGNFADGVELLNDGVKVKGLIFA